MLTPLELPVPNGLFWLASSHWHLWIDTFGSMHSNLSLFCAPLCRCAHCCLCCCSSSSPIHCHAMLSDYNSNSDLSIDLLQLIFDDGEENRQKKKKLLCISRGSPFSSQEHECPWMWRIWNQEQWQRWSWLQKLIVALLSCKLRQILSNNLSGLGDSSLQVTEFVRCSVSRWRASVSVWHLVCPLNNSSSYTLVGFLHMNQWFGLLSLLLFCQPDFAKSKNIQD